MSSPAQQAFQRSLKAMAFAKARLADDGITYPIPNGKESAAELYERCRAFSDLESKYYIEFLQSYSNKAIENKNKEPIVKKEWKAYGDD